MKRENAKNKLLKCWPIYNFEFKRIFHLQAVPQKLHKEPNKQPCSFMRDIRNVCDATGQLINIGTFIFSKVYRKTFKHLKNFFHTHIKLTGTDDLIL